MPSLNTALAVLALLSGAAAINIAVDPNVHNMCPVSCRPAWTEGLPDADIINPGDFDAASNFPVFKGTVAAANHSTWGVHLTPGYVYSAYDVHANIVGFVAVCPATRFVSDSESLPQPQLSGTHPDRVTQRTCHPGPMSLIDEAGPQDGPTLVSFLLTGFTSVAQGPTTVNSTNAGREDLTSYFPFDTFERADGMRFSSPAYLAPENVARGNAGTSAREWNLYNDPVPVQDAVFVVTDTAGVNIASWSFAVPFSFLGTPAWTFGSHFNTTQYPNIPGPSGTIPNVCMQTYGRTPQAGQEACTPN